VAAPGDLGAEKTGHFLTVLGEVAERYHWICHAYCLMTNHYDLVAGTVEGNLSQGMRHLNAAREGSAD